MPGFFVRDRPDRASPRKTKKSGDFPARKPGEPSVTNVIRKIEFHLLTPGRSPKARPLGVTTEHWVHKMTAAGIERGLLNFSPHTGLSGPLDYARHRADHPGRIPGKV